MKGLVDRFTMNVLRRERTLRVLLIREAASDDFALGVFFFSTDAELAHAFP